jgi:hypothetical protein
MLIAEVEPDLDRTPGRFGLRQDRRDLVAAPIDDLEAKPLS